VQREGGGVVRRALAAIRREGDEASPRLVRCWGHQDGARAWPVDTTTVQYTDGDIFADFARAELKSDAVVAESAISNLKSQISKEVAA
jgi:hypothetical protein